LVILLKLMQAP